MRRYIYVVLMIGLFGFGAALLNAQSEKSRAEEPDYLSDLKNLIKTDQILGKPIKAGTTTVIPFARFSFGLGGGGFPQGFGGGMGGQAVPMGVLIIEKDQVRLELLPVEKPKPSFLQQMLPIVLEMLPRFLGDKFPFPGAGAEDLPGETAGVGSGAETGPPPIIEEIEGLYNAGKYQPAYSGIQAMISRDSGNAELYAWKGMIASRLASGNPANMMKYGMDAMQSFEKALSIDPENIRARTGRGIARMHAPAAFGGGPEAAIPDLEFVVERAQVPEAWYYLGGAYQKQGNYEKARDAYKQALALNPDYSEAAEALAKLKYPG